MIEEGGECVKRALERPQHATLDAYGARYNRVVSSPSESLSETPPWMWPNLLSLDAPAVAVVWALLFARARGVFLSAATMGALALAVWLIYLGDRVLDGWRMHETDELRQRHIFCTRHRAILIAAAAVALFGGAWLARDALSISEAKAGLRMCGCVGIYMICVHAGGETVERLLPKEIVVGLIFAAGTALPIWSEGGFPRRALASWALFGLLCALNCVAIECWENQGSLASPILTLADRHIGWVAAGIALAAQIAHFCLATNGVVAGTIAVAAGLIFVLDCLRGRLSVAALRVLVDAALAIPAVFAILDRL